ncbi:hypothetical protein BAS09_05390 [Elizabethkingia ursingii]|uniref:hypothetical protein n=1 Tax=Elizabethkingia ursingii TaxID=1756150 RepID=UPI00099A5F07|nr:hypothetical protein [Elizabethkingia ursingii]OPC05111.1 hypothetical protein BAS09_05390 [Elizabethkingia ursingii]
MKNRIILSICLSFIYNIKAQSKIDQAIKVLEQKYAQEKIYLLFDKEKYIAGENIWFKSFIFDGYNRSAISSSILIELYDRDKNLISKKIFPITNGEGNGSINLPEKLKEDIYFVRAYTPWMANFNEDFQLVQPIPVYNPSSPQRLAINNSSKWIAKAYPEGGTVINSIPTKYAVRLHSEGPPPSEWSGYVTELNNPDKKLVLFTGLDQNVGLFSITPEKGKSYKLTVEDKNGTKQSSLLPTASDSGINLQISSGTKGIQYTIKSNNISGLKGYTVVGTINNLLAYKAIISQNNKEISSIIPATINQQMNGVLQITVFDEKENIAAQRLCFIEPEKLNISTPLIQDLKFNKIARAYNNVSIPSQNNYSAYTVFVRDESDTIPQNLLNTNNVLSALWLTGDFSSKIYSPAQYFEKNANSKALDALLISEKWKRFDWNTIISGKVPEIKYKSESYLSYKGKVTVNSRPIANIGVNLIFKTADGDSFFHQVNTDFEGYFNLDNVYTDEPLKVTYFIDTNNKETANPPNLKIIFTPLINFIPYKNQLPIVTTYYLSDQQTTTQSPTEIIHAINNQKNQKLINNNEILINEVQLKAKKRNEKKILNDKLSTGILSSMDANIFDLINENQDAQSYQNISVWLQGKVPGLLFKMDEYGEYTPYIRGGKAKMYLDDNLIEANTMNGISVSNIAMVKVFKGSAMAGNAVVIYTKKGNTNPIKNKVKDPSMDNTTTIMGYDKVAPYYEPDYTKATYKNITNDTRNVLYWNPDLKAESMAPSIISFYNNDEPQKYQITIIGFDKNDKPLYYNGIIQ